MTIHCPLCKIILVEGMNIKQYLKKYPDENYMWCCYCGRTFPINIEMKGGKNKDGKI